MSKSFKSLFPDINIRLLTIELASPFILFIILHCLISRFFDTLDAHHLPTLYMFICYQSAITVNFAFDGISQNKPNRIPLIRTLPDPQKTVRSAIIELVMSIISVICIYCVIAVLFPALFESVIPEPPKMIPVMIFCTLIFFGIYLSICTFTNSYAALFITFVCSVITEIPMIIAEDKEYYTPMLIATAILAAISVIGGTAVSLSNIGRRVQHD